MIEWKKIGRTRDILIHVYFDIDNDIIWNVIIEKLPEIKNILLHYFKSDSFSTNPH